MANKHGFVHPIEAILNAYTWYPSYFKDIDTAEIIIDGIIHHMFPIPVRAIDGKDLEINNQEKFDNIPINIKKLIIYSSLRYKIGPISLCKSKYKEGKIMSRADKIVFFKKEFTIASLKSFLTGLNKKL